eukprot:5572334-Ditylum_brightwellii.AAC.2
MVWTKENPEAEADNNDADHLVTVIHAMIHEFWGVSFDLNLCKSGTLAPVSKKGDLLNPNKWIPVCLLETM